jgi:hypothetical protein
MAKGRKTRNVEGGAAGRTTRQRLRRPNVRIETVHNDEHPLPTDVASLFDDLLARSAQAAQADQELRDKMVEASADFRREQIRLQDALAKQVGVSAAIKEFERLRDRHTKTVVEAFESASSAVLSARRDIARGSGRAGSRRK